MSESKTRTSRVDGGRKTEERFDDEFTEPNWLSIPDSVIDRHPELESYLIYSDKNGDLQTYVSEGFEEMLVD